MKPSAAPKQFPFRDHANMAAIMAQEASLAEWGNEASMAAASRRMVAALFNEFDGPPGRFAMPQYCHQPRQPAVFVGRAA